MSTRPDRDDLYMSMAFLFAERSTCERAQVGAVIVRDDRILSGGYNGAPSRHPHCLDVGCELDSTGSCLRAIHAEANAILWGGGRIECGVLYATHSPCIACAKLIVAAGIQTVFYKYEYRLTEGLDYLTAADVEIWNK